MGDSNDEDDGSDTGIDLTGFLFGNIDDTGRLEDDFLDNESKRHLSSLAQLGLSSLLREMLDLDAQPEDNSDSDTDNDSGRERSKDKPKETEGDKTEDYNVKSPSAVDYSDILELAEDDLADLKAAAAKAASEVKTETDYDADDEGKGDGVLMPPPAPPGEDLDVREGETAAERAARRLETPLAAMLPSKYENVDVTEIFPDFRVDKVLRFSRLFGPGKPSSLPQIWRSVRKRRRKRRAPRTHDASDSGSDGDSGARKPGGWALNYGPPPTKEMCCSDDEEKLLKLVEDKLAVGKQEAHDPNDLGPKAADWRFGPAQVWYDMLEVPESGEGFDYGFKLRDPTSKPPAGTEQKAESGEEFPDDAFLMISQLHWEDDVVWNGDDIKHQVMQKLNCKSNAAGWVPSGGNRTAQAFSQPGKGAGPMRTPAFGSPAPSTPAAPKLSKAQVLLSKHQQRMDDTLDDTWYSIFPVENEELVYGVWEDEVIWDAEAMTKIPTPKILTLDPNDENIILGIPDDVDPAKVRSDSLTPAKVKIPHPHVKKSKILLGKAGVINVMEEDAPPPPPKSPDRDPFNISNDVYYMARSSESALRLKVGGGNLIQHSTPVVELRAPFVQTHMGPLRMRNFHRPPMKRYSHGPLSLNGPHSVLPLLKHIRKKAKQREQERIASGGGDVFFMRTPEDLTGRDGDLVLIEFNEEHPPLTNQVGMCSKMKNYYKRKAGKDQGPHEYRYGDIAYAHTSPFLGHLPPGQSLQAIENNMYRAPIYEHKIVETDFVVIRTRQQYYIREVDALFIAGQECPLYEVPGPNSKRANNFVRDFLQVFIYRLFWKSRDLPKRIKMDDIKKAFPSHSESSIRKRLKLCADFKRTGMDSNWWVIKPDFRLPTEEEIRAMVSPEQCCAYFSMVAAEQRLKDAGYGEKFLFTPQEDDDEEMQLKMDDEVKVAPWNTTRAYIQAIKGKCLLQLTGPADPTGCGEGFSYVRVPNKPTQSKEEQEAQPKRTVTGTDADLRRLSLNNAKALLRKFGVPEDEIKKLSRRQPKHQDSTNPSRANHSSRWEVIDVVRTLSTEKAKAGEEGMTKFSRGNRFSIAEHQERYKEECQRIFDLQNRVLSSYEVLSTDDEGESSDEDSSDIEEMGKNIENMLSNKKTSTQLSLEKEEQERQELRKMIMEGDERGKKDKKKDEDGDRSSPLGFSGQPGQPGRVLKIARTFRDADGKEYTRYESVRKQDVIDTYLKIRTTKDEAFIRQFATLDEHQKEEMKREKRRIQEQLRRIKRNQERERMMGGGRHTQSLSLGRDIDGASPPPHSELDSPTESKPGSIHMSQAHHEHRSHHHHHHGHGSSSSAHTPKRKKPKLKPDLKLKCGACGNVGHMRTNKACPLYQPSAPAPPMTVAMTEEQEEEIEKQLNADSEDLVNVDGTKVKLSSKLLRHAEDMKRRTLLLKVPKEAMNQRKRRRAVTELHCDYLKRQQRPANRRRTDPVVVLSTILEDILNEMRDLPDVQPFLFPVNAKVVPDYHRIVVRPMDLQSIRDNLRQKRYQSREDFLSDVNQIVENSTLYNGSKSSLTVAARRMLGLCADRLAAKEERLMRLEKAINPLLDDNDQVALTYILDNVVNNKLKSMSESWPFLKPVNKKLVKDYYSVIRHPMDLETVAKKVKAHKYHSRREFCADIERILQNCVIYNGTESTFTQKAEAMVKVCRDTLDEYGDHLTQLEHSISLVQERALEQAEMDSLGTWPGGDEENYTIAEPDPMESGGSVDHGFDRSHPDDYDFVDVEADPDEPGTSGIKKDVLEEDLQFSSEDGGSSDENANPDDDSQMAAMAMVQLGNMGYYPPTGVQPEMDESMDVDPDYDPSDFLMQGLPQRSLPQSVVADLQVSGSDEEVTTTTMQPLQPKLEPDEPQEGDLWF